jgi:hypothetical protein
MFSLKEMYYKYSIEAQISKGNQVYVLYLSVTLLHINTDAIIVIEIWQKHFLRSLHLYTILINSCYLFIHLSAEVEKKRLQEVV